MANALFAFEAPEAARRAAEQLRAARAAGDAPLRVELHVNEAAAGPTLGRKLDEQLSGGLLSNMLDLFQGVFDWGDSPHDASSYEETLRRGGAVLSVDAATDAQRAEAERLMLQAGCSRHTAWRAPPP